MPKKVIVIKKIMPPFYAIKKEKLIKYYLNNIVDASKVIERRKVCVVFAKQDLWQHLF